MMGELMGVCIDSQDALLDAALGRGALAEGGTLPHRRYTAGEATLNVGRSRTRSTGS